MKNGPPQSADAGRDPAQEQSAAVAAVDCLVHAIRAQTEQAKAENEKSYKQETLKSIKGSTWAAGAAAIIAAIALAVSVFVARDTHQGLVTVQRAYLTAGDIVPRYVGAKMTIDSVLLSTTWLNDGNTPTKHLKFITNTVVVPQSHQIEIFDIAKTDSYPDIIGPHGKTNTGQSAFTLDYLDKIVNGGKEAIYFYGQAEYDDMFDAHHIT